MLNILLTILTLIIIILLWIALYDSTRFIAIHHTITDPRIKKSCRAIVIADLHNKEFGPQNERLLAYIRSQKPDIILIPGDIPTAKPGKKLTPAVNFMKALVSVCPIYYANGNHEQRLVLYPETYGAMAEEYEQRLKSLGIDRLINSGVLLSEYGLHIYGVEIEKEYYRRFRILPMTDDYLHNYLGEVDKSSYSILLAHNPDYFPWYAKWGADLVLSGHVHGGIVRIPGWRGVVSPLVSFFPKYDGGTFKEGNTTMLLSRGLGMHTIPIRLFNPGEVLVIDLKPEI